MNETVIALIRPKPKLDLVAGEPAEAVAAARAAVDAPDGIGTLTSYATEVALLVKCTWKNPAIGSARADFVLTAPQAGVPLTVVRIFRPRRAPSRPRSRISRAAAQRATRMPSRCSCLQTLCTP